MSATPEEGPVGLPLVPDDEELREAGDAWLGQIDSTLDAYAPAAARVRALRGVCQ
jgi:hypothetical protein